LLPLRYRFILVRDLSSQEDIVMGFIRLFPLEEIHPTEPARFGYGDPARARAIERFAAPEWVVQVSEIRRFEDCPLYLVSEDDPNVLVDGIRMELRSGTWLVVANDASEASERFETQIEFAMQGRVATLPFSQYLTERERALRRAGVREVTGIRIDTGKT
jgi:hypothetical protein